MAGNKQHFVPQYFLRNFASQKGVFVFDKKQNRYLSDRPIPLNKIGYANKFYDCKPEDLRQFINADIKSEKYVDDLLEKYNERISSRLIHSFIDLGEKVYANNDTKLVSIIYPDDLIDFAIVQLFRTPSARTQFLSLAEQTHKRNQKKIDLIEANPIEKLARTIHCVYIIAAICNTKIWENSNLNHLLRPEFRFIEIEIQEKVEQLRKMSRNLSISGIDDVYKTSDTPIVLSQNDEGEIGLLMFPITKRCCISFTHSPELNESIIVINQKNREVLDFTNRVIFDRAYRFVYSYHK